MNDLFAGFIAIDETLTGTIITKNTTGVPTDADSFPTCRIYGPAGVVHDVVTEYRDSGVITGATNATPIVITSADHGLTVGAVVVVSGVLGNTAANGTFVISAVTTNTFTLQSSVGNGAYTSGGVWHVKGAYKYEIEATEANGFASGENYFALFSFAMSASQRGIVHSFLVD